MLLSTLQEVFSFAQSIRHSSGTPSTIVRREVRVFADLAFLGQVNLARPIAEEVYVGDASTHGWCLMSTSAHYSESNEAAKYHERWRFHDYLAAQSQSLLTGPAMEHLGGLLPLGGGHPPESDLVPRQGYFADALVRGKDAHFV